MEGETMIEESVWVIGFDKETGLREKFVCCPKNNSKFYQELYIGEGFDVKILAGEEVDKLIEAEKEK